MGARCQFSFSYRSLYRTSPAPGGDVRVVRRDRAGHVEDSFAVAPLILPPYQGGLSGAEPLYAAGYIRALAARLPGFELQGEGKTRVDLMPAYNIYYSALVGGRTLWGRDVLLVPEGNEARRGVVISMLTPPRPARRSPRRCWWPRRGSSTSRCAPSASTEAIRRRWR